MPLGEIGGLTTLADQDHARVLLDLGHRLDNVTMAQPGGDLVDLRLFQNGAGILEDRAPAMRHQLCALLIECGQFLQQRRPRAQLDRARQIRLFGCLAPSQHVQEFHRRAGALRDPGRMLANRGRIHRPVHQCDHLLCHASCLPQCDIRVSMAPGLSWIASLSTVVSEASFMPLISTSAPSRRNLRTAISSACTEEISQICAPLTSITTLSSASLKSKAFMKSSTDP